MYIFWFIFRDFDLVYLRQNLGVFILIDILNDFNVSELYNYLRNIKLKVKFVKRNMELVGIMSEKYFVYLCLNYYVYVYFLGK